MKEFETKPTLVFGELFLTILLIKPKPKVLTGTGKWTGGFCGCLLNVPFCPVDCV